MLFRLFITIVFLAGLLSCEKNDCKKSPSTIQIRLAEESAPREDDCGVNLDEAQPATDSPTPIPAPQIPPVASAIVLPDAEPPVASPAAGVYTVPQTINLGSNTSGASIYYTVDGTSPTTSSTVYSGPISFSSSLTIKAISVKSGYKTSSISTFEYSIGLALPDPTFSPAAGAYGPAQSVTITSPYSPDAIYYTLDGSEPTTASNVFVGPIYVGSSATIKAFAVKSGWANSQVSSSTYVINGAVSQPSFSVAAGAYGPAQSVSMTTATTGSIIYYTTDGSTPTTSSTQYTGPINVNSSQTIRAIAVKQDYVDSSISSAAYTINGSVATPTFSIPGGSYGPTQTVTISTTTNGATIYYTTNGTTPTTASAMYSSPISVVTSQTVRAIAVKNHYSDSSIASASYTINGAVAAPTFSVSGGAYGPNQNVALSTTTSAATIYYTLNGSTPTTASTRYTGSSILVSSNLTIRAIAVKADYIDSTVSLASYVINGAVATPAFNLATGPYSSTQTVTISTSTSDATIYYNLSTATPTASSTVYSGPITVSSTTTITAIAMKSNFSNSSTAQRTYTITNYNLMSTIAGNGSIGYTADNVSATTTSIYNPSGIAVDSSNNVYIADTLNHRIRKINTSGIITTYAGNGDPEYSGDGSAATNASLFNPYGLTISPSGDLYFSDQYNNRIRKIDKTTGIISTVAGSNESSYSGDDGPATAAGIKFPAGIAFNAAGDLFIAEPFSHRVRKVDTSGTITTIAGTGVSGSLGDGGAAHLAQLASPTGVAVSSDNKLYIADSGNRKIRVVDLSTGTVSTFAGTGSSGSGGDGGLATAATFKSPRDIKVDSFNNVLILDYSNHTIRMVKSSNQSISLIVGTGSANFSGDGQYPTSATLNFPLGITLDASNNLFIADSNNNRIRKTLRVP